MRNKKKEEVGPRNASTPPMPPFEVSANTI